MNDPYYYDPYRHGVSYKYASSAIPGIYDLDYYGDWRNVDGYGYAWSPRVASGWVPYQQGYWINDYPYGLTWVSSEPWGYAPYHYGRWANVGNQWYWIPDAVNTTPAYAPALVAFVPLNDNQIGWFPLGRGDSYAPRYYDSSWQPHYLTQVNMVPGQLVNFGIPGAVTVVSLDAFGRPIDARSLRRIDPQFLASVRPTLDPLTLTPLRNAVIHSAWGRGKIDLPPGIAKKLDSTRVFVAGDIRGPRFGKDVAKSMRVERVADTVRNQKFKVKDQRQESQQVDHGRKQELDRHNAEAAKGNKEAQRLVRQVEQQQANENKAKAQPKAQQQPQGERVGNPAKPQPPTAPKQERKKTPAQPAEQGQGQGKGKGKRKP